MGTPFNFSVHVRWSRRSERWDFTDLLKYCCTFSLAVYVVLYLRNKENAVIHWQLRSVPLRANEALIQSSALLQPQLGHKTATNHPIIEAMFVNTAVRNENISREYF